MALGVMLLHYAEWKRSLDFNISQYFRPCGYFFKNFFGRQIKIPAC